jgi:hypothetical protein
VVYVCSPDWQHYLFSSLRSLLASGSSFDRVVIFCVGARPASWTFVDPRILVESVPTVDDESFLMNKTYLCTRAAERVIFLDTDTLVLRPLDTVWRGIEADVLGRVALRCEGPQWDDELWREALAEVGSGSSPYLNSGFLVFQNGSHRALREPWIDIERRLGNGELPSSARLHGRRYREQLALSLAIGSMDLSCHELSAEEHRYGFAREPHEDAVVYHTGGPGFLDLAPSIERARGLHRLELPQTHGRHWLTGPWAQRRRELARGYFRRLLGAIRRGGAR